MKIKVSEFIVKYLERLGVKHIFGMPGAHILPVYDSLYDSNIEAVLVKHEQGAAFMAGGYARDSGQIAACITTAGPGATNLVTGIANAYADKQPILIITGETPTYIFGKGGLQESSGEGGSINQGELFKGITRYNRIVERTDYLPQVLNKTSHILNSSNPGPVLLSFPFNIQNELIDASLLDSISDHRNNHCLPSNAAPVERLSELLQQAKRPVIIAGYGCIRAGAQQTIRQLSEQWQIPVASSLKGKGALNELSPLSLGSLGVTSSGLAYRYIVEQADLLLILGASFNERTSYLWDETLLSGKSIVQIDTDAEQLEKVFAAELAIQSDINEVLTALLHTLPPASSQMDGNKDIEQIRDRTSNDYALFQSGFSLVEKLFQKLEQHLPEQCVIFDDNIIFAQNFYRVHANNRYYPNSGISSLGHAIPAAIGARFHRPATVFAILGDGGFQMCCMEIMTAVNYNKPINIIVFNNASMGLIRKNQSQHYQQRYINCDFINPDFELLARSFGIHYQRIEQEKDIDRLFHNCDLQEEINLIEVMLDRDTFPNYSSRR